jgi:hypothetical protein
MAGLYERVKGGGTDRINIHLIVAGVKGYAAGIWSRAQILTALNNQVSTSLDTAEQTDLNDIADVIDALSTTTDKLVYVVGKLEPSMIAAEINEINETKWRTDLGI